jgi:hypothetical protein
MRSKLFHPPIVLLAVLAMVIGIVDGLFILAIVRRTRCFRRGGIKLGSAYSRAVISSKEWEEQQKTKKVIP